MAIKQNDPQALAFFREYFLDALDSRNFQDCEETLEILSSSNERHLQQAAQHYRAVLHSEQRQFDRAEQILRTLLEEQLTTQQRARSTLELAIQLDELGQWQTAYPLFMQALGLYQTLDDQRGEAKVYNNLAISLSFQAEQEIIDAKQLENARSYHETALTIAKALDDQQEIMRNLHGLGRVYGLLQAYEEAEQSFETQLQLSRQQDDRYTEAVGLTDLAKLVYMPQGRLSEAESLFMRATVLLQEEEDDLHLAEALTHLGNNLAAQHKEQEALAAYTKALNAAESVRNRLTVPLAKAEYRATIDFVYRAPLSFHLQRNDLANALTVAERARSRVLADLLADQDTVRPYPLDESLVESRNRLRIQIEEAYKLAQPRAVTQELEAKLATLDRQISLLDSTLSENQSMGGDGQMDLESQNLLTAQEIQASLAPNAVMLSYVPDNNLCLHCLVVTRESIVHVALPPQLRIPWLQGILPDYLNGRRQAFVPSHGRSLAHTKFAIRLYEALVKPILPHIEKKQTIYLVPTGPLNHIPIHTLAPDREAPPLMQGNRYCIYAPSATVLFRYCHQRPASPFQSIVTIAPTAADLRYSIGAATNVAQGQRDLALVHDNANRQAFLKQTADHRIICYLGHALFNTQHPMLSYLQLSDGQLQATDLLQELRISTDLVVLAACETGRSQILRGDEMLGLSRALLYAGTPAVLVTAWKVHELTTRLFIEEFFTVLKAYEVREKQFAPARALATTQNWLRTMTYEQVFSAMAAWQELKKPEIEEQLQAIWAMQTAPRPLLPQSKLFDHPFFWAPYMLLGEPRPTPSIAG